MENAISGPGLHKKAIWAMHAKQTSEEHFSMVSASVTVSRFMSRVPTLSSLSDVV